MKTIPHPYMGIQPTNVTYPVQSLQQRVARINNYEIVQHIKGVVLQYYGISESIIFSKSRKREHVTPRQIAIYLIKKHTTLSLVGIGKNLVEGHIFDHSTVIHAIKTIENLLSYDKCINKDLTNISNKVDDMLDRKK